MKIIINGKRFKKYISKEELEKITYTLAEKINSAYNRKNPIFLIVLKGSIFFAADLLRKITIKCTIETIRTSSYGMNMTGGNVKLSIENLSIKNKHVIIIEDIVDTGNTIKELLNKLSLQKPKSIAVTSLLLKPNSLQNDIKIEFVGKKIPSKFVIGYGLDYAEKGRNLPEIYILDE